MAFRTAAVEVIRRGHDLFIVAGDTMACGGWSGANHRGIVVELVNPRRPSASEARFAGQVLSTDWQTAVQEGTPLTCTT